MTLDAYFPKKRGRPRKEGTVADRIYYARQKKLRQAECEEPLTDFEIGAIASRLTRRR